MGRFRVIVGTTPTFRYDFNVVDPADITQAVLTIATDDAVLIEKELSDADVGADYLSWTLTQQDTLLIPVSTPETRRRVYAMINWLTNSGQRGASNRDEIYGCKNDKNEVMS